MMPAPWRLATKHWQHRPLRPTLCALLVLIGVALVFLADAGLSSGLASLTHDFHAFVGTADVRVKPRVVAFGATLPHGLLARIRRLQSVALAGARDTGSINVRVRGRLVPVRADGVSLPSAWKLHPVKFAAGGPARSAREVVLDTRLARNLGVKVGSPLSVQAAAGKIIQLQVSGLITPSPIQRFLQQPAATLSRSELSSLTGVKSGPEQIAIKLWPGVQVAHFVSALQRVVGPAVRVIPGQKGPAAISHIERAFTRAVLFGAILAAFTGAVLIAVMMGVGIQARVRELGQLRCVGASRGQLLQSVLMEAALPGVLGTAAGLLVGWGAAVWLIHHFHQVFSVCLIGHFTIITAVLTGVVATSLGALVPVFLAWRVGPMQAVVIGGQPISRGRVWAVGGVGATLILIQIGLWQVPAGHLRFILYLLLGGPLIFLGTALLAPLVVVLMEKPLGAAVARLWWIRPELLKGAWSRRPWRSGAMVVALLVGIAFFTAMRSRAAGLLASWEFPRGMPDVFVFSPFKPLPAGRLARLEQAVPGVAASSSVTAFWVQGVARRGHARSILFVAIQPRTFPRVVGVKLISGGWRETSQAFKALEAGLGVLIAEQAHRQLHLRAGDDITLGTLVGPVRFKVVAIADSPEINMANRYLQAGRIFRKVASIAVVGTMAQARRYFGVSGLNTVMIDVKPGFHGMAVMRAVKMFLAQPKHGGLLGSLLALPGLALHGISIGQMKRDLDGIIKGVMQALSIAGLGVLVAASVGVALLLIAAVRARRHEFGILRAVGAGRWQMCRMVLAETSLVVLAACILGALQGIYMTFMATRVDHLVAGFHSHLVVAWAAIGACWGLTAGLALLMALWPALRASGVGARALMASGRE